MEKSPQKPISSGRAPAVLPPDQPRLSPAAEPDQDAPAGLQWPVLADPAGRGGQSAALPGV